jgi:hypothetical protein
MQKTEKFKILSFWENESKAGTKYLNGSTMTVEKFVNSIKDILQPFAKDDDITFVGFYDKYKQNPKAPDLAIYLAKKEPRNDSQKRPDSGVASRPQRQSTYVPPADDDIPF